MNESEKGRKDDQGKLRWGLLPFQQVSDVVGVLTAGAEKYADHNWQKVENPESRYFSAMMRHIVAYHGGEFRDPESGYPHLAHAVCNALFLMWFGNKNQ